MQDKESAIVQAFSRRVSAGEMELREDGTIWRFYAGAMREAETRITRHYRVFTIFIDGQPYQTKFHRLMWLYFVGTIPEGMIIHHKDGNGLNNALDNLECMTVKEHRALSRDAEPKKPVYIHPLAPKRTKNGTIRQCLKCGHTWISAQEKPKRCPHYKCNSATWSETPEQTKARTRRRRKPTEPTGEPVNIIFSIPKLSNKLYSIVETNDGERNWYHVAPADRKKRRRAWVYPTRAEAENKLATLESRE